MLIQRVSRLTKRLLAAVSILIIMMVSAIVAAPQVVAQDLRNPDGCNYHVGGPMADQLCWIDFSDMDFALAATPEGQRMTINLDSSYQLNFTINTFGAGTDKVSVRSSSTWANAVFNNPNVDSPGSYIRENSPVTVHADSFTGELIIEFSDITMARSGTLVDYGFAVADAESTNLNEALGMYSDKTVSLIDIINPPGRGTCESGAPVDRSHIHDNGESLTGLYCGPRDGNVGMMIAQVNSPTVLRSVLRVAGGAQALAIAVQVNEATGSVSSQVDVASANDSIQTDPSFDLVMEQVTSMGATVELGDTATSVGTTPGSTAGSFLTSGVGDRVRYTSSLNPDWMEYPDLAKSYLAEWTCTVTSATGSTVIPVFKEEVPVGDQTTIDVDISNGEVANCDVVWTSNFDFSAELELGKFVTDFDAELSNLPVAGSDDFTIVYVCTHEDFEDAYAGTSYLNRLSGEKTLSHGDSVTITNLPVGAECVITEEDPVVDPTLKWELGWVQEEHGGDLDPLDIDDAESITVTLVSGETPYVEAVNQYRSALVPMELAVAHTGNAAYLFPWQRNYDVVCELGDWEYTERVIVEEENVATGFRYVDGKLIPEQSAPKQRIEVLPGAQCEVISLDDDLTDLNSSLALTGDTPTRTPYTYFLDDAEGGTLPRVSGDTTGDITDLSIDDVDLIGTAVEVNTDVADVTDAWKNHRFSFVVPEAAEEAGEDDVIYTVNVVHVMELDTRDIVVTKDVPNVNYQDESFGFNYEYDVVGEDGRLTGAATRQHGESFTIEDVPVGTELTISELLGEAPNGPIVTWELTEDETPIGDLTSGYEADRATALFNVLPATDLATPAANWNIKVTNNYAELQVTKLIGQAGSSDDSGVIPAGSNEMTITYTVANPGLIEVSDIVINDPTLVGSGFTLPAGVEVDADGNITGLTCDPATTILQSGEDFTCSITVTIDGDVETAYTYDPGNTDNPEVTATGNHIAEDRIVLASDTDTYGAVRISTAAAMLPNTGAISMVVVLGLGVLVSVGSLIMFLRSRRN